jgi:hypothetical protein
MLTKYIGVMHYRFEQTDDPTSPLFHFISGLSILDGVGEDLPPLPEEIPSR